MAIFIGDTEVVGCILKVPSPHARFGWGRRLDKRVVDGETEWFFLELPGLNDAPFQLVAIKTKPNIPNQR